ncbi:polynucleotide kinase [Thalassovita gelatinovora]|uniref:Polynucleotide kinase n=1 Tax=Thalassovita gelatinovora TaxID=53501 RepID=A0A0P1F9Z9_THAGE|nr:HAD family acid phosphatase [Thalassovita gelatinovora]QIZ81015.1 polynucleotide kinase [Thalassovita gelatinovora]CUH65059.1 polynucleotide kinase [Thalassovita gelatinovora]SEP87204.1 HAD superfamily, subfamily IIIB (Acid phosphatase) [Thalassovita gelatinovora]
MNCVIFDIDGTLAEFDAPQLGHLVHGATKQWDAFHDAMATAPVIEPVVRLLTRLNAQGEAIVLCSGRPEGWRDHTAAWLATSGIPHDALYLRRHDEDHASDPEVKRSALDRIHADGYRPWLVVDDRSSVVAFWREAGLTCLQCAPGDF